MASRGGGIPSAVGGAPLAQDGPPQGAVLLAPRGAALARGPAWLPCGPACAVRWPLTVRAPAPRAPQTRAARWPGQVGPTAREEPCRGPRQGQAALLQPAPPPGVAACRLCLGGARAHAIVCGATPTRCASPGPFALFCPPAIEPVVPAHLGPYGGHRAPVRGPGAWGGPLAVWVEPPGLPPRPPQAQPGTRIETLRSPPHPPRMVDGLQGRREGRRHHPGRASAWAWDGPCLPGLQGSTLGAVASATAQQSLRVEGCQDAGHGPWQARVFSGGSSPWARRAGPWRQRGASAECGAGPCLRHALPKGVEVRVQGLCRGLGTDVLPPEAASVRRSRPPCCRTCSLRLPSQVRHREPLCRAAFWALPGREGGMGGRSCLVGPCCLGRLRLPVRPCPVCTALPAPRPLHGAAPLRGLRRPGGGAARGRAPQAPSGPPTYRELRSPPPTRWVAPARPSGRAPPRVLGGGCWGVHTIAGGMRRAHGAGARCSECGLSGGLRGALGTLHRCCSAAPPSPRQHAGGVGGETLRRRALHPARNAKLRLAH